MKRAWPIALLILLSLGSACGAQHGARAGAAAGIELQPLYGTAPTSLSLTQTDNVYTISLAPGQREAYVQLNLPDGLIATDLTWQGLTSSSGPVAIAIALPNPRGLELGVCALPSATELSASLSFELAAGVRETRIAPTGTQNQIPDFNVANYGVGQVILGWTQINAGDLDLNGEVNAGDLAAIAKNFGLTYNTADPAKNSLPLYWIDGDGNGEVNAADLATIGQNYRATVDGYNIRQNGLLLPGAGPGLPTVTTALGSQVPGLPRRYGIVLTGLPTDNWQIFAVDTDGAAGVTSPATAGSVDILANLQINGISLYDLSGQVAGGFGTGKFSSRIIDPIENVGNIGLTQPLAINGTSTVYGNLPKLKTLLLAFRYLPTVNLVTGQSKQVGTARRASVTEADFVNTAIPITLPNVPGTTTVDANIELLPNPSGGYFVELTATVTTPGGTPATSVTRLDYAGGTLNRDTDNDGVYDDELTFDDDDKDCVSNLLIENELDDDEYGETGRIEARMVATVDSVDQASGTLNLSDMTLFEGDIELPVPPLPMRFSEATEYEDGLLPANLQPGSRVEVHFYQLADPNGVLPEIFWAESFGLEQPADFAFLDASDSRKGEIRVRWGVVAGYQSFTVKRLSPRLPSGNYELDWEQTFSNLDTPELTDTVVDPGVEYHYVYFGFDGGTDIELAADAGVAETP